MAETLTVLTPPVPAVAHDYRVVYLALDWAEAQITIRLQGPENQRIGHHYRGDLALQLMRQLNTANLSALSLQRRILQRLIADGVVAGTIAGTPD